MNKIMKMVLSAAAVCLALGIILSTIGFFTGGRVPASMRWFFRNRSDSESSSLTDLSSGESDFAASNNPSAVSHDAPAADDGVTSLDFDLGAAEIFLITGDHFDLQVEGAPRFENRIKDGEWKLQTRNYNVPNDDDVFIITIPRDMVFDSIEIAVGAGVLHAEELQCQTADFGVGAGTIEIDSLLCQQKCSVEIGAGTFALAQGTLNGEVDVECGLGKADLRAERPQTHYLELSCSLGTVNFDGTEYRRLADRSILGSKPADSEYKIDCSLGTVTVEFY